MLVTRFYIVIVTLDSVDQNKANGGDENTIPFLRPVTFRFAKYKAA